MRLDDKTTTGADTGSDRPAEIGRLSWRFVLSLLLLPLAVSVSHSAEGQWGVFELLDRQILPGERAKFSFITEDSFAASFLNMPVFVTRGARSGPTLCVTAGIHGDEINGIEIARRVFAEIDAKKLSGTLIVLPSINAEGFRTGSRTLSDRRDLNRAFPGKSHGSVAAIIADGVFSRVLMRCDAVVDLHTASNNRANLPQIRADLTNPAIKDLAVHFGVGIIVNGPGPIGSLRRAVADAGIPVIIYEAGEPLRFQEHEIERGVSGVLNIIGYLQMIDGHDVETPDNRIYERSRWLRASPGQSGFFFPVAVLGDKISEGDLLGRIVDPISDEVYEVRSGLKGQIVGMAVSQPVLSGYALYHVAWKSQTAGPDQTAPGN